MLMFAYTLQITCIIIITAPSHSLPLRSRPVELLLEKVPNVSGRAVSLHIALPSQPADLYSLTNAYFTFSSINEHVNLSILNSLKGYIKVFFVVVLFSSLHNFLILISD